MTKQNRLNSFVLILLFFTIFFEGCVSKGEFLAKTNENETLAQQLQNEHQKSENLQKEKDVLKERLKAVSQESGLREKEQTNFIKAQSDQISLLEVQQRKEEEKKNKLESDRRSLEHAMDRLKAQLSGEKQQSASLADRLKSTSQKSVDLEKMLGEAEKLAAKKIRDAQESVRAREHLIESLKQEIQEGHVQISQMNDRLSVQILSKILFPSGSDRVTEEGKMVLIKVSDTLKRIRDNKIRIEGHTDNVPIGSGLANKFPSNWELSTARATQVVRLLAEEQVSPDKLMAVGMAEYTPVAPNDTPEGRQKNRRIEIILSPQ